MINSPRRQDATQRTGRSNQQGLPAQRRKIIHDRLISPYRNSQQEQKKKNRIRNRLTDLLQQFYFKKYPTAMPQNMIPITVNILL